MASDDRQVGRLLTRRELLAVVGLSGATLLLGRAPSLAQILGSKTAGCVVRPEQTEGPYFVDEHLNRADIRLDPTTGELSVGAPLQLVMNISELTSGGCQPVPRAQVDIWHCNAFGVYSDVTDPGFNTTGRKFLRGHQLTDKAGTVRFTTIYPGWYSDRTVHIHFKVRTSPAGERGHEFTSQLYFDDAFTDQVYTREPYARRGAREVRNRADGIFRRGGDQLMLDVARKGDAYATTFNLALQLA